MTPIEALRAALAEPFDSLDVRDFGLLAWDAAPALLALYDAVTERRDAEQEWRDLPQPTARTARLIVAEQAERDAIAAAEAGE